MILLNQVKRMPHNVPEIEAPREILERILPRLQTTMSCFNLQIIPGLANRISMPRFVPHTT